MNPKNPGQIIFWLCVAFFEYLLGKTEGVDVGFNIMKLL